MRKEKQILTVCLALFAASQSFAVEQQPTVHWEADWIGCAEARKENKPVFYARKVFEAPDGAASADLLKATI